jgi:hypothetical protein
LIAALTALIELMPPPRNPRAAGNDQGWASIESRIGTTFPTDYKDFIALYGPGEIDRQIGIVRPFSEVGGLEDRLLRLQSTRQEMVAGLGYSPVPYPAFPELGGLLPWGHTANGDVLSWVTTTSSPDSWVVCIEDAECEWEVFEGPMTSFLVAILSGSFVSNIVSDLLSPEPTYTPW